MRTVMRIEFPVLGLAILPHDPDWQPGRRFWSGYEVEVPEPYQGGPRHHDVDPFPMQPFGLYNLHFYQKYEVGELER